MGAAAPSRNEAPALAVKDLHREIISDVPRKSLGRARSRAGIPIRYGAIIIGSGLLLLASALFLPFGPATATPVRGLATVFAGIASLGLFLGAGLSWPRAPSYWIRAYTKIHAFVLGLALLLTLGTVVGLSTLTWFIVTAHPSQYYVSDIVSMTHADAELVVAGKNPYTADEEVFRSALERFPLALGTPLRGNVFGTSYDQPDMQTMDQVQRQYTSSSERIPGAFDPRTLHSYPALSFLLYVPWLWAGGTNIVVVNLIIYLIVFTWLIMLAPVTWRRWSVLAALASMTTVVASLIESNEVVCIALILLAWRYRHRRWVGAVLLGLACAFKQYAWFFAPFFAVEVLYGQGWRAGLRWGAATTSAFLLPNMPFILADPQAWIGSMGIPMSGNFFAVGMGIIQLSSSRVLPYLPQEIYALLEVTTLGLALWIAVRKRQQLGPGILMLALAPLFMAFRSSPNYFAFTPWMALYAVNEFYVRRAKATQIAQRFSHDRSERLPCLLSDLRRDHSSSSSVSAIESPASSSLTPNSGPADAIVASSRFARSRRCAACSTPTTMICCGSASAANSGVT